MNNISVVPLSFDAPLQMVKCKAVQTTDLSTKCILLTIDFCKALHNGNTTAIAHTV